MTASEQVRFLYPWPPKNFMGLDYEDEDDDEVAGNFPIFIIKENNK